MSERKDKGAEEHRNQVPMSLVELEEIRLELLEALRSHDGDFEISDEIGHSKSQTIDSFIERQLKQRDRYGHIFRTEKGSVYFVLRSGESWRLKKSGETWEVRPIIQFVFYVDAKENILLKSLLKAPFWRAMIVGRKFQNQSPRIGVVPVEIGTIGGKKARFKVESDEIVLLGDDAGFFDASFHRGHPIAEVL